MSDQNTTDPYMSMRCRICGYRRFDIKYVPSTDQVHVICERCSYEWWMDPMYRCRLESGSMYGPAEL